MIESIGRVVIEVLSSSCLWLQIKIFWLPLLSLLKPAVLPANFGTVCSVRHGLAVSIEWVNKRTFDVQSLQRIPRPKE